MKIKSILKQSEIGNFRLAYWHYDRADLIALLNEPPIFALTQGEYFEIVSDGCQILKIFDNAEDQNGIIRVSAHAAMKIKVRYDKEADLFYNEMVMDDGAVYAVEL